MITQMTDKVKNIKDEFFPEYNLVGFEIPSELSYCYVHFFKPYDMQTSYRMGGCYYQIYHNFYDISYDGLQFCEICISDGKISNMIGSTTLNEKSFWHAGLGVLYKDFKNLAKFKLKVA